MFKKTLILCLFSFLLEAKGAEELVFGQSAAFSGSSKALGSELWRGAQAYFDYTNKNGGVNGRRIRIEALDDGYEGNRTLINTINLVNKKKVFNLFGYVGTPTIVKALPGIQKLSKKNITLFSNFTGAQPQREEPHRKNVFNIRPSYRQETSEIVKHLVKIGHRQIAVFIQFDAYGRSGADGVGKELKRHNLKITAEATYKRGIEYKTNVLKQVEYIKESGATAVVSIGSYNACAAFIRDARNSGFKGPIANVSFVGADSLLRLLKNEETISGVKLTHKLINSQVVPPWNDISIPLVKEYQEMMDKFKPKIPIELKAINYTSSKYGFVSLEGFLNAKVLVSILKKAPKELTRREFIKAVESTDSLDIGLPETISFSSQKHQALNKVYLTTIQNGEYIIIKNWDQFK
jgi:branched-chain amino acid transport system substrate-binding protein